MISYLILALLHDFIYPALSVWTGADLHIDNNSYLNAFCSYMGSLNQFLPITDGFVPIMTIWWLVFGQPFSGLRLIFIVLNIVRGAGAK